MLWIFTLCDCFTKKMLSKQIVILNNHYVWVFISYIDVQCIEQQFYYSILAFVCFSHIISCTRLFLQWYHKNSLIEEQLNTLFSLNKPHNRTHFSHLARLSFINTVLYTDSLPACISTSVSCMLHISLFLFTLLQMQGMYVTQYVILGFPPFVASERIF